MSARFFRASLVVAAIASTACAGAPTPVRTTSAALCMPPWAEGESHAAPNASSAAPMIVPATPSRRACCERTVATFVRWANAAHASTEPDAPNDESRLRGDVDRYRNAIAACYACAGWERTLRSGRERYRFVVARDGRVAATGLARSDFDDPDLARCVMWTLQRMQWPRRVDPSVIAATLEIAFDPVAGVTFLSE